jgi:hypothetical protein
MSLPLKGKAIEAAVKRIHATENETIAIYHNRPAPPARQDRPAVRGFRVADKPIVHFSFPVESIAEPNDFLGSEQ